MNYKETSEKISYEVYLRDKKCVICGKDKMLERSPHHCFYKSEYFKEDRDESWNRVTICMSCHNEIHAKGNTEKQKICKDIALARYSGKYKRDLIKIMNSKKFNVL